MVTKQQKTQHLYLRAGFGAHPKLINQVKNRSINDLVDDLFKESHQNKPLDTLSNPLRNRKELSNFRIALQILRSKEQIKELNMGWLNRMASNPTNLREKMTFFWHGHFATKVPFAYLMQLQNNTLRTHALGNFREMLHAISQDPAMLIFLNNQQNKKLSPNENFARELMELFTLGEGNIYSERDIKEAARAFTGWKTSKGAKFEFSERTHDFGIKEFMGQKGNFNGSDIVDIILDQPQTAKFIASKIYRFFVNDNIDANRIDQLGRQFMEADYDIAYLLKLIFKSDWFYDEVNVGGKIISPVELIVRYRNLFDIRLKDEKTWLNAQHALGQVLFNPPNVSGWSAGKDWIDSSSLLFRMNLAPLLFEYNNVPKWSGSKHDWNKLEREFSKSNDTQLIEDIIDSQIQVAVSDVIKQNIATHLNSDNPFRSIFIRTMMLPEFQLI